MADDARKKELLAQETSKEELELLEKDFEYCRKLKSRHFDKDLQKVMDEVNEVLNFLQTQHLVELNLDKYYIEGETDPKSLENKLGELKKLLFRLYQDEIEKTLGQIDVTIIPKRKNLVREYVALIGKQIVDQSALDDCDRLLIGGVSRCLELCRKINNILHYNKSGDREKVREEIQELRPMLNDFINTLLRLLNQIMYIDSVIQQVTTEAYGIEDHLVLEFNLRKALAQLIEHVPESGVLPIEAGNFKILFVRQDKLDEFKASEDFRRSVNAGAVPKCILFDEKDNEKSQRRKKLSLLFMNIQKEIEPAEDKERYRKLKQKLVSEIQVSKEKADEPACAAAFSKLYFHNIDDNKPKYCIFLQDHEGKIEDAKDAEYFNNKMIQFMIFHTYKSENFDRMLNSIVEPFFLGIEEKLAFTNYKRGLKVSYDITKKILAHQLKQKDITDKDHDQILRFMEKGYDEVRMAQAGVAELIKRGEKDLKYINFIKRPYLVHQLMMDVLRVAIFAEARAKVNTEGKYVYTGRESGFEGANTVAVHGFNNYLKYKKLLQVVLPVLRDQHKMEVFDHFENFRAWLVMGLHDAATYDRQNSIAYAAMDKYGNSNKKAHNMIGSYILHENEVIKKLFRVQDPTEIDPEGEEKKDLDTLASIVQNHDYGKIHLDLANINPDNNKHMIKQLVLFTLSGIADNSAGVGFVDDHGDCHVDPWEEKGSTVFLETAKGPEATNQPVGKMTNPEIMWYILDKMNSKKNPDYFIKDAEGKSEWEMHILPQVKSNVSAMPEGIVKDKLLRGIAENEFSQNSALWTAGVLNSGFMQVDSYDGKMMVLTIVMDSVVNARLAQVMGADKVYGRIGNFLKEYAGYFYVDVGKFKIGAHLAQHKEFKVYNSDEKGNKLESIGLHLKIREVPNVINKTLIEQTSKDLLKAADTYKQVYTDKGA